jgi:hypothetical protein
MEYLVREILDARCEAQIEAHKPWLRRPIRASVPPLPD